ncbi:unnamed protein product (macronuclear) [Paramecium tetraurelia]|uniref:Uncharacterized protein n=1 Tax=Paramecium tetraurelia TaxID=5888 RepID=A0E2Q7_PARTE|nr:uncharacterized protein GSPATT00022746001 [Paramecium tetraurelia]CAK89574.1 unnamed protein product [Paramecium tetraurelia]|eukprot:XP_001456971.1 hypothetical protein (macronuclear) [Paramecium tetraurelia strain d4-2]
MFKPTVPYCEIQKRQKTIFGMHLFEIPTRNPYYTIVGSRKNEKQKTTSSSQNNKLEFLTSRHMTTLPVTPTSKSPSFLESSRLLVLKQVNLNPRIKQLKPKAQLQIRQQIKTENINKKCNQSFRVNQTLPIPRQNNMIISTRIQQIDSQPSECQDFIDYVCIEKLI